MIMRNGPRPNLFVIGAMKCGTTSLHAALAAHPQIFMCRPKEPDYFIAERNWSKGERWYLSLFARAGDAPIIGESSTGYTKAPTFTGVPQRIMRFQPSARFIYIMRDPIERAISQYWHHVRREGERRDMLTAILAEPHFRDVSHYAAQLAPYVEVFGRDRIYPLTLEELVACPSKVFRELLVWLGVNAAFVPQRIQRRHVTPDTIHLARTGLGVLLKLRSSRGWHAAARLMPRSVRTIGLRLIAREVDRTAQPVAQVAELLRPLQRAQTQALSRMLGRQFPEWTTLFGKERGGIAGTAISGAPAFGVSRDPVGEDRLVLVGGGRGKPA